MVTAGEEITFSVVPGRSPRWGLLMGRLSSLTLCFTLMIILALWLCIGILLTYHPAAARIIKGMNDQLILSWLLTTAIAHPLVSTWLLVLLILSGMLLLNLICCCFTLPGLRIRLKSGLRPLLLLMLHVLAGLVMIGHGAHMVVGFKSADMKLQPGQNAMLPGGRTIHLKSVECSYVPLLQTADRQQRRRLLTRDRVKLKDNYIDFTVLKDGTLADSGRAYLLGPFRRGSFRVTLNGFFPVHEFGPSHSGRIAGAVITVADNPLHEIFFCLYAAMLFCFLAYWIVVEIDAKRK